LKLIALVVICVASKWVYADLGCVHSDSSFNCVKYIRNYDADTVTFDIPNTHPLIGKSISVRVYGIDTPEKRGSGACEKEVARTAQKLTENLLRHAKRIDLLDVGRDKYFRVLARVRFDGKDLSETLLKNGLAYPYFGKTKEKRDWCKVAKKAGQ